MRTIKLLTCLLLVLVCGGFSNEATWVIDAKSKLSICGTSNVNSFTCSIKSYSGHDTLRYFNNYAASKLQFTTNRMTIPVKSFDCGSSQISKDFQKTLKSEAYPHLDINFISLENNSLENNSVVKCIVDITLAGVTTRYGIQFVLKSEAGTILLSGNHAVNFSDFKLKAPRKLRGLVQVKESLDVNFQLVLKAV